MSNSLTQSYFVELYDRTMENSPVLRQPLNIFPDSPSIWNGTKFPAGSFVCDRMREYQAVGGCWVETGSAIPPAALAD